MITFFPSKVAKFENGGNSTMENQVNDEIKLLSCSHCDEKVSGTFQLNCCDQVYCSWCFKRHSEHCRSFIEKSRGSHVDKILRENRDDTSVLCVLCDEHLSSSAYDQHTKNCGYKCQFGCAGVFPTDQSFAEHCIQEHKLTGSPKDKRASLAYIQKFGLSDTFDLSTVGHNLLQVFETPEGKILTRGTAGYSCGLLCPSTLSICSSDGDEDTDLRCPECYSTTLEALGLAADSGVGINLRGRIAKWNPKEKAWYCLARVPLQGGTGDARCGTGCPGDSSAFVNCGACISLKEYVGKHFKTPHM